MNIAEIHDESPGRSYGRDVSKYVVAGERVPSVTEVLELAGLSDIQRIMAVAGEDVVQGAARRGSRVHIWSQIIDADPDDFRIEDVRPECRGYVAGYLKFLREMRPDWILTEEPVVSTVHRFAGTVDRVGYVGGLLYTVDLKTPVLADPSWRLQTSGYRIALDEQLGERTRRACLQLKKNGTYKFHPYSDPKDDTTFLAAVHVAHYRLANGLASLGD